MAKESEHFFSINNLEIMQKKVINKLMEGGELG